MFFECESLVSIELDLPNVTDTHSMFLSCGNLLDVKITNLNPSADVTNILFNCESLKHAFFHPNIKYQDAKSTELLENHPDYFI